MKKIKICEDDTSLRDLLFLCLQLKGYQVEMIPDIASSNCPCTAEEVCASALIVSTECPDKCKAILDEQERHGCKIPKQNKVILSAEFSEGQREEIEKAGYIAIEKPYRFADISGWLDAIALRSPNAPESEPAKGGVHKDCLGGASL